jgi:hypothetical protein
MSKWVVWSRPAPIKVLAVGVVIAVAVALPLIFILHWLGVYQYLGARVAVTVVMAFVGLYYVNSRRPAPKDNQP